MDCFVQQGREILERNKWSTQRHPHQDSVNDRAQISQVIIVYYLSM